MREKYLPSKEHALMIESIRKSYNEIYNYLISLDFISELKSIKEKNPTNKKLNSILIFFGASYFKKYIENSNIINNKKLMKVILSVLFDILEADQTDRILWITYSKKDFIKIKEELLKFNFRGKKTLKGYF
ncbi:hypothetical protein K9M42_00805 [Patescibacteria group bacterium]|nr:hypothetical protein [Patescibacteria group bacterium]